MNKYVPDRERNGRHRLCKHPLYRVWNGMKTRCYNCNHIRYKNYGGKGITICDDWLHDFKNFYEWAINNGWQYGLTIDRKENDKGYYPDNCRISTYSEQNNNRGPLKRLARQKILKRETKKLDSTIVFTCSRSKVHIKTNWKYPKKISILI